MARGSPSRRAWVGGWSELVLADELVDVDVGVLVADLEVDLVGEVEAALGLDDVLEHAEHVPVLVVELQLDIRLVPLEVLGAHRPSCPGWWFVASCGRWVAQGVATPAKE